MAGRGRTIGTFVTLLVLLAVPVVIGATPVRADAVPGAEPAVFSAVTPCRLADTREPESSAAEGYARVDPRVVEVQVTGRCGIADGATAASFVVTAVNMPANGFVTVYPADLATPPLVSNLNARVGQTRANGAVVRLSASGTVRVFSNVGAPVVLDVSGAFHPASEAAAGRFVAMTPQRVFDSASGGVRVPSGGIVDLPLPAGVPADAVAVAVEVTASDAVGSGFVAAYPRGGPASLTSALNFDAVDAIRSATSVVAVSPDGVELRVSRSAHLAVDVLGYFTGPAEALSADGRFVAVSPTRVLDTRGDSPLGHGVPLYPGGKADVLLPVSGAAVVLNLTVTSTSGRGSIATAGSMRPMPGTPSVNSAHALDLAANLWIGAMSTAGVTAQAQGMSAHHVIDVFGWFTGVPQLPNVAAGTNVPDSSGCLPGVGKLDATRRWYQQDNTSANTSAIAWYPGAGPLGALAVMGDSLTWQTLKGTMNHLVDAGFGPICIDSAVYRNISVTVLKVNSGVDATNRLRTHAFWTAPTVRWAVAMGSNDVGAASTTAAMQARIDDELWAIGPTARSVLWMNVRTRRSTYQTVETRFDQALAATPNVVPVDWSSFVSPNPALYILSADLVHLTATGIAWRPVLLTNALVANS